MSTTESRKVSVLGGGAWGTALALHCARKGHDVLVWAREKSIVDAINIEHENSVFCKVRSSSYLCSYCHRNVDALDSLM